MSSPVWNLFHRMDDCFSPLQRKFAGRRLPAGAIHEPIKMIWAPALDVSEVPQAYLIKVRMPGLSKEEVRVMVDNGVLTFAGDRKVEGALTPQHTLFTRSFSLPNDIEDGMIAAQYKAGVLSIRLPRMTVKTVSTVEIRGH